MRIAIQRIRILLCFLVVCLATALAQAPKRNPEVKNPDVGTWKLNMAQTKANHPVANEVTMVVREVGDRVEVETISTSTVTNGSVTSHKFTFPQEGGVLTFDGSVPPFLPVSPLSTQ